jgi:urease accessory protein
MVTASFMDMTMAITTITAIITTTNTTILLSTMTTASAVEMARAVTAEAPFLPPETEREVSPALSPEALRKLLAWLSPAFPVGGFSYSHGLEWAIEDGTVTDAATLEAWIAEVLAHGAGRNDAVLFRHAWVAADAGDTAAMVDLAALGAAFQPARERHLEATAQGRAFLAAVNAAWPTAKLGPIADALAAPLAVPYAVAVAASAAAHDIPAEPALAAFLNGFAANIVSAGVRAIPVGQTDGLRVVAALGPVIAAVIAESATATLEDLGGAALRADIAAMRHETQYTRLFRS